MESLLDNGRVYNLLPIQFHQYIFSFASAKSDELLKKALEIKLRNHENKVRSIYSKRNDKVFAPAISKHAVFSFGATNLIN